MANKMFYIKDAGSHELCMVYGYVQEGYYHLFYRSKSDINKIQPIGDFPSKQAWEIFNKGSLINEQN
jgi:hypothetical protein